MQNRNLEKISQQNKFKFKSKVSHVSNAQNARNDDDEEEAEVSVRGMQYLPYFESTRTDRCIKVYLDENIREAKYYRTVLHGIESLGEGDVVLLSINSYGGHLDGAIAIINAIQDTDANVHASIEGVAASAASLIALASPSISVSPYATMMVHSATFGAFGKQSDVISHASFVDKQVRTLMHSVYKDFLTDKELEEVIMGKEMWFDAEEIVRRLELRAQLQEKREKAESKKAKSQLIKN
jgi:ATP-dependent protease ClpP protease subunit